MARRAPGKDVDDRDLSVGSPKKSAAGVGGIVHGLAPVLEQVGVVRGTRSLLKLNQANGFDCPGCAWPDPAEGKRAHAEFCENGAKAVAEEATLRRVTREFFAEHSLTELGGKSDYWLGQQGRLTEPMVAHAGASHYTPISWDDAFAVIARELRANASPDEAAFYTSGRTSNEAAFLYQLFARAYGTNNLPDCSNMCHESSGTALTESIGVGKGSVSLNDIHEAKLLVIVGQNPGTNHPRMLTALEIAKKNGARIIAVNPLPEAGLMRFRNPQTVRGIVAGGTPLADSFLQIKVAGDLALFQAIASLLIEWDAIDHAFIDSSMSGFDAYAASLKDLDWDSVLAATGLTRAEIEATAHAFADSPATIVCWAMGLTQRRDAVAAIQEIANVQLLRGMIGKPGAGLCPVRGHSNVQGDRTMGVWEKPPKWTGKLGEVLSFTPPAKKGYDTVETIHAMRDGKVRVFMAMGGNFAAATPDTAVTEEAIRSCALTVAVSTKLNRSHVVIGKSALILPCLGRTEVDGHRRTCAPRSRSCAASRRPRSATACRGADSATTTGPYAK